MFKRILVPLDGTETTDQVIYASVGVARQVGASITCFVAEPAAPSQRHRRRGLPVLEDLDEDDSQTLARANGLLQRLEAAASRAGVPCTVVRCGGSGADKALVAAAESCDCDLMLLVTTGRGVFGEPLFGSQTKAVLAGSKLPLLLLPLQ